MVDIYTVNASLIDDRFMTASSHRPHGVGASPHCTLVPLRPPLSVRSAEVHVTIHPPEQKDVSIDPNGPIHSVRSLSKIQTDGGSDSSPRMTGGPLQEKIQFPDLDVIWVPLPPE